MAHYQYPISVVHRCGHIGNHKVSGDQLFRLRYTAKLRERACDECRDIIGGREVIEVNGKEWVLHPIITGTDAQIVWAVKIRRKLLTTLLNHREPGFNPVEWMQYQTTAKFWIDQRNLTSTELIQGLQKTA